MTTALLFPVVFFSTPKGGSISFYVLVLCSLIGMACGLKPMGKSFLAFLRTCWPLHLAMSGLVLAVLAHQLWQGDFSSRPFDMPSRLACFSLLFWVLLVPGKKLKHIQWSLALGALFCAITLHIETAGGSERPLFLFGVPLIPFGNIAMMMGILALFSIGWNDHREKAAIAFKLLAGGAALYGSYLSQTRGGWLALPLFVVIAFAVFQHLSPRRKLVLVLLPLALICSAYFFSDTVQRRVAEAGRDIDQYFSGQNKNTSVGLRLQLWEGAWVLFKENPMSGIGREQYPAAAQQLMQRQVITPDAALQPHSHSDLLFHMVTLGIFGLLAMLSLYLVPAFYFLRDIRHMDRETRTIAGMGLVLSLGFFVFGLTDVMFYWRVSYTFYAMLLAVLCACLVKRKALLASQG